MVYGNPETTTGGNALKFYASVRLDIRKTGTVKNGEQVVGNKTRVKVVKNKVAPPFRECEFEITYGRRWSSPLWMGHYPRHLASSGDTLWALAENGLISSKSKTETATPLIADSDQASPHGLWIGSHGEGWVVGRRCPEGTLVCDRGAIWRVRGTKAELVLLDPAPGSLYAVWGWPGGAVAVGQRNTVMVFDGSTWKSAR